MKIYKILLVSFIVSLILLLTAYGQAYPVQASSHQQGTTGDKLVFGGSFRLADGEILDGDLLVVGATVTLEEGSLVDGDLLILGGSVTANGEIQGDIFAVGGVVNLGKTAVVTGDVNTISGSIAREEGSIIEGKLSTSEIKPFQFTIPEKVSIPQVEFPNLAFRFNPVWNITWVFFRSFLWAALAVLLVLFLPRQSNRAAESAGAQPFLAGGLGCLTVVVVPILLVAIAITILGIPIAFIGAILFVVALVFGVVIMGLEVGKRLSKAFGGDWALPAAAGVGTFILTLVVNGLNALVPCVGWIAPAIVGTVGLGAVILTRFGSRSYPPGVPIYPTGSGNAQFSQTPAQPVIEPESRGKDLDNSG